MIIALLAAWGSAALAWAVLVRTPEPDAEPGPWTKPSYRSLRSPIMVAASLLPAGLLGMAAAHLHPWPMTLEWALLAGAGGVLALCDLRTTYLPQTLLRPLGILLVLGLAARMLLAHRSHDLLHVASSTATAVLLATGLFWLLWRVGGGLGFGDVRLVGLLALAAGPLGLDAWYTGLLAGTVLGALMGIGVHLWRRRRPSALGAAFAYGPALWLGAWAGVLVSLH